MHTNTATADRGASCSVWWSDASADASTAAEQFRVQAQRWSRSQQQLVLLAATIDDSGIWLADGYPTAASWIAAEAQIETCTAREWLRISRALATLPLITVAYEAGELSYAKVRALTRVATPANEAELLPIAFQWPANQLATALAVWLRDNTDPEALDRIHRKQRRLSCRVEPDGMYRFTIVAPPDEGGTLETALDSDVMRTRPATESAGAWPSLAAQYFDAFSRLIESKTKRLVEVVVHVDADGGRFDNGVPLTDTAIGRMLDGAFVRALIHDDQRTPIDATNRRRHPTTRQKRVVAARDQGCVDCGSHDLVNYDHQPPFGESQHTVTSELEQRCAPCHHHKTNSDRR